MRRLGSSLVWTIVVLVTAGGLYWLFEPGEDVSETVFEEVGIERGAVARTVSASGTVGALITVEVGSELSGQITQLHADFNSAVSKGALIALIDPRTFAARVTQSEASVEVARANLKIQEASLVAETATYREAEREFKRKQSLFQRGHVAESALDTARADVDNRRARVQMARAQVAHAAATVRQQAANLMQARIDLARTEIRAPIDGVVIERSVNVGQTVAASLSSPMLFRIAQDLSQIQIDANVDEADIGAVTAGNPVRFSVDAFPDDHFDGAVEQVRLAPKEIDNVVTYTVVISARNEGLKLLPGMTANVEIATGARNDVLRVANTALRFRPPGMPTRTDGPMERTRRGTLWQQDADGALQARDVEIGMRGNRYTEIIGDGIAKGDRVVAGAKQVRRRKSRAFAFGASR